MAKKQVPAEKVASALQVQSAIEALTAVELRRLELYGKAKIRALGHAADGRDWEDLRQEAVRATLTATADPSTGRKWNLDANPRFVDHLHGAMRSIASHWKEAADHEEIGAVEVRYENEDGNLIDAVESGVDPAPGHVTEFEARARIDSLLDILQDDETAQYLLLLKLEGKLPQQIRADLNLPDDEYEAKWKKIQYRARRNNI